MHIVISNPDGIGDVILRLPLFTALAEAGHDLTILCRPHAEQFIRRSLPNRARVSLLRADPYEAMRTGKANFADDLLNDLAGTLTPDTLLVVASYQWTAFEEQLAARVAQANGNRLRLSGFRYLGGRSFDAAGEERVVEVEEACHESEKNHALAEAVLQQKVARRDPVLRATAEDLALARGVVERDHAAWRGGAEAGGFWLGLVGNAGDYYGEVKEWGHEKWVDVVRHLVGRGRSVLLTGSDAERDSLERVRRLSGGRDAIAVVTGDITTAAGASLLVGLTSMAEAYIGKDSGPMHIAAALGKPVVSLFGGGHWPRFTPMATPSLAVAVEMPCSPCGWLCGRSESFCVKLVPSERVISAVDAVLEGRASRRVVELLPRECNPGSWKSL